MSYQYAHASPVQRDLLPATPRRRPLGVQPPSLRTTALDNAHSTSRTMSAFYEAETPISAVSTNNPFSAITPGETARSSPMSAQASSGFGGAYNPQQWGPMSATSANAPRLSSGSGQIRSTYLAPRPVGPDEPVCSPPPPYSPRREQADLSSSSTRPALVTSPADTISPNTDPSHQVTPVSAATTISPDFAPRPGNGRSPVVGCDVSPRDVATARMSIPAPPTANRSTTSRLRSASRNHADRLLSSVTSRSRVPAMSSQGNAIEALQHSTTQALQQAPVLPHNEPPRPPASRRAASTGGIGLTGTPLTPARRSPPKSGWETGMPLPPPPPGPPPASARSQSLSRASSSESSSSTPGPPPAFRTRTAPVNGTQLGPVPPTPADWREESPAPCIRRNQSVERPQLLQPLHIDTGKTVQRPIMSSDDHFTATPSSAEGRSLTQRPRRDSSTSALFRTPAVRDRSAKGIRERRSESRNGRDRVLEPSSAAPREGIVASPENVGPPRQSDLAPSREGNLLNRRMISMQSPRSNDTAQARNESLSPRSPFGAVQERFASIHPDPQPDSTQSGLSANTSTPTPPFSPGSSEIISSSPQSVHPQAISPKALPTPPIQNTTQPNRNLLAPRPSSQERPISHLLHIPNGSSSLQQPLVPLASPPEVFVVDLLGSEPADSFAQSSIERHRAFATREAAATTDTERLKLFMQYMSEESKLRRERYAGVLREKDLRIDDLMRDFFQPSSADIIHQSPGDVLDDGDADSMHGSVTSDSSSEGMLCRMPSSANGKKQESPITNSSTGSPHYQPDPHRGKEYHPSLSPIASMSVVTGQDEENSRGRAPSRWWEGSEGAGREDPFSVLGRSKRESKYMGLSKEARDSPAFFDNVPASSNSSHNPPASNPHQEASYAPNEYPHEKAGWHKEPILPPPPPVDPSTPRAALRTPNHWKLDVSRLVTLPPPYPRHHPAVNNNHPDLSSERAIVRSLNDITEASDIKASYKKSVKTRHQRADSWSKHQRSLHAQEMQFRIDHGEMSEAEFDRAETELEEKLGRSEKEATQVDFDQFQIQVVTPLHAIFSSRIETATSALNKLSSHLFDSAQSHSPNMPQEQGDDSAELLEKLTMLKWLFEARETLHRETYNLLSERNDKYKAMVMLPYKVTGNTQKQVEAEAFFARDARERQIAHDQAVSSRMEAFLKVIEGNVTRGVEIQLSAFWDIAPNLLSLVHKVPSSRTSSSRHRQESFSVQVPAEEYEENASYHAHPLQYLYSLLTHAEKSTYQFIESQTNLFCLLHEMRFAAMNARIRAEVSPPENGTEDDSWEIETRQRREVEERQLTEDLKEKVGVVEGQWDDALGADMKEVRERVRGWLLEEGGWDEELEESV